MIILLDTQIFLWYISGDLRLPQAMRQHIRQSVRIRSIYCNDTIAAQQSRSLPDSGIVGFMA